MKKIYELSIPNRTIIFHFLSIFASNFLYLYFTLKSIVQMFPKYTYSTIVYIYLSRSPHICFFLKFFIFSYDTDFERNHAIYVSYNSWADWKISTSEESCAIRRTIGGVLSRSPSLLRGASRVNTVTILISCAMAGCP